MATAFYPESDSDAVSTTSTLALRSANRVHATKKRIWRVVHNHIVKIHQKNGNIPPPIPSNLLDPRLSEKSRRRMSSENQNEDPARYTYDDSMQYEMEDQDKSLSSPVVEQLMSPLPGGSSTFPNPSRSATNSPSQRESGEVSSRRRSRTSGNSLQATTESRKISNTSNRRESGDFTGRQESSRITGRRTSATANSSSQRAAASNLQLDSGEPATQRSRYVGNDTNKLSQTRTEAQVLQAAAAKSTSSSFFSQASSKLGDNCSWWNLLLLLLFLIPLLILLWWIFLSPATPECPCLVQNYGCPQSDVYLYGPVV